MFTAIEPPSPLASRAVLERIGNSLDARAPAKVVLSCAVSMMSPPSPPAKVLERKRAQASK